MKIDWSITKRTSSWHRDDCFLAASEHWPKHANRSAHRSDLFVWRLDGIRVFRFHRHPIIAEMNIDAERVEQPPHIGDVRQTCDIGQCDWFIRQKASCHQRQCSILRTFHSDPPRKSLTTLNDELVHGDPP